MTDFTWLFIAGGLLLVLMAIYVGFDRLIKIVKSNFDKMETGNVALAKREKLVLASAFANELTENRVKCEAFITIYSELLRNLRHLEQKAAYENTGDFIHQHPPLSRNIFDSNVDKLYLLGTKLSDDLMKCYAAVRSEPQYIALEAKMPRASALRIVEMVLDDAQKTLEPFDSTIAALHVIIRDGNKQG
jgi:hypothetical protein